MKQSLKTYNLFYLFVCLVWLPLHYFILRTDAAGRTIMFLSTVAVILNFAELWKNKRLFTTGAFVCWSLLLCYSIWNVFTKGFDTEFSTFQFLRVNFLDSFVFLIVAMLELSRDRRKALRVICSALGIYLLIGLPFFTLRRGSGRFGIDEIGNLYPLYAVCFLFVSSVLFVEKKIGKIFFMVAVAVASMVIVLSASRKAFGAEAIILLGIVLNSGKKKNVWSWIRIAVFGLLLLYGVMYVMNHAVVGDRIMDAQEADYSVQLVDNDKVNDFLLLMLDDRSIQYALGLELFYENFWTGIGLTNFKDASGFDYRIHSEYIVQLCENGMIGFSLLILYYVLLIRALRRNRKSADKNKTGVALFGLIALLFLNFTTWTYCVNYAMVFYAIVLMYAYSERL